MNLDTPQQNDTITSSKGSVPHRITRIRKASRHPHAVPVLVFIALLFLGGLGFLFARQTNKLPEVHDAKIVIISYDHQKQVVPAKNTTVGDLLMKLNITLQPGDVVEPAAKTHIDQDQFRINIYRAVPVQVVDGNLKSHTFSAASTARTIAKQAGQTLYPEDIITQAPTDDFVRSGAIGGQVVIDRATPVNVDLYGTPVVLRTHASTVGDLIKEKKIVLTKDDKLSVPTETPIAPNQQIAVLRTGMKVENVTEDIPAPVQTIADGSLAYGTSAVRQQGSPGQQTVTYQIVLKNNVEVSRTAIQKVVNKEPVTQITVMGSSLGGIKGDMALAGISPSDYMYVDYIIGRESGWCPTKAQGQYGGCPAFAGSVPSYGGYGLCQSTPGSKMASAGADWMTNPVTQLRWCSGYAHSRYGSWAAAYNHWVSNHNW
ncbi:MAG: ubiquitin-like domain-containing protein [Patescibacteria group bacterium]|nr:ubiquitin-like domain-containing protein [Patescibacteria group bacterium]